MKFTWGVNWLDFGLGFNLCGCEGVSVTVILGPATLRWATEREAR